MIPYTKRMFSDKDPKLTKYHYVLTWNGMREKEKKRIKEKPQNVNICTESIIILQQVQESLKHGLNTAKAVKFGTAV